MTRKNQLSLYLNDRLLALVRQYGRPGETPEGQVRDLLEILGQIVEDDATRLSLAEARALADVVNGWWAEAGDLRYLWAEVADAVQLDGLARRWGVDGDALVARLRALPRASQIAVALKLRAAWRRADGDEPATSIDEALRAVGLVADDEAR